MIMKLDLDFYLDNIGKKEIIKSFRQNRMAKDFFSKYFEKLDINNVGGILAPPNIMFQTSNGNVVTQISYHLPNQEGEITIELDKKLKLKDIKYCFFKRSAEV